MPVKAASLAQQLNAAKFLLVLITVLAVVAFPYIPKRTLPIYPGANIWWGAFADAASGGNTGFEYKNDDLTAIECTMGDAGSFNMCGNNCVFVDQQFVPYERLLTDLNFAVQVSQQISLDLSRYSGLWIDIDYQGPANFIHLSLQNHEPALNLPDPNRQFRPQSVGIATQELHQPIYVRLKEFKVSDWWVRQFALHRSESDTHFNRIRAIAIEIKEQPPHTKHYVKIKSITFVGEWISKENFYLAIIIAFATLLSIEGAFRVITLYNRHRATQQSLDALNDHNQKLQSVAFKDELTQLLNRRAILEVVDKDPDFKSPKGHCVIIIDIDHFKKFNDTYGHALGDKVLATVAKSLREASRDYDQISRWGGEEFVIVTRDASIESLLAYAEKLREKVATTALFQDGNAEPIYVTISLGIASRQAGEGFDVALERADKALYQSKDQGRNRCSFL